ncbi:YheU family protein [Alteromonas sp. MTD1]|uniref:YheU family protein n=1 Tax=Alteromonas sp. MTD1 TaxID=3057962 RepID=UPI0036F1D927
MIIPVDALEPDTLYSLAEAFVLREGTDYGEQEVELDVKVQQVLEKLKSGDAVVVYSELHESVDIKRKEDIQPSDVESEDNDGY